jgi:hypothetical protein
VSKCSTPRQGKARQGKARQGKARQGKARKGKARQGKARIMKTLQHTYLISIFILANPLNGMYGIINSAHRY